MDNTAPAIATTADMGRLAGLDTADLSRLHRTGIVEPTKPGKQGNVSREYDTAHTIASMAVGDFRRRLGIVNRKQLTPIVQAIVALQGFVGRHTRLADGAVRLEYQDFPRYVVFNGAATYTTDEKPNEPVSIVVDVHSYLARMFLLTELNTVEPRQRLATLRATGWTGKGPGGREAFRLSEDIISGVIPEAEAAQRLGVTEEVLRLSITDVRLIEAE